MGEISSYSTGVRFSLKKTTDKYTVGTVYLGSFAGDRMFNVFESG